MNSMLGIDNISRKLSEQLNNQLSKSGILFRIFHRVKSNDSIDSKIKSKNYTESGKKITDLIGIRVTLYFQ
jgi:putative GTP pyrophosphokinase